MTDLQFWIIFQTILGSTFLFTGLILCWLSYYQIRENTLKYKRLGITTTLIPLASTSLLSGSILVYHLIIKYSAT